MLHIKNLKKIFGSQFILNGVDLKIPRGEIVGILGSSGSGKSTLLRCVNQLEVLSDGIISIDGHCLQGPYGHVARSKVGMVFQNFHLFPHMTVLQNLLYAPTKVKKISQEAALEKAFALLKRVGLGHKINGFPSILSGGEKQRVAIARTLMMDPEVILFDEPCSGLDPISTAKVEEAMLKLKKDYTIVLVTNNVKQAARVGDRTAFFLSGELIELDKTEKIFTAPSDQRTDGYIRGKFG